VEVVEVVKEVVAVGVVEMVEVVGAVKVVGAVRVAGAVRAVGAAGTEGTAVALLVNKGVVPLPIVCPLFVVNLSTQDGLLLTGTSEGPTAAPCTAIDGK